MRIPHQGSYSIGSRFHSFTHQSEILKVRLTGLGKALALLKQSLLLWPVCLQTPHRTCLDRSGWPEGGEGAAHLPSGKFLPKKKVPKNVFLGILFAT